MNPTKHHKTITTNSPNYGIYYRREIAAITYVSGVDNYMSWSEKFHPRSYFGGFTAINWLTPEHIDIKDFNKLSAKELKDYLTTSFYVALDVDNQNWKAENRHIFDNLENPDFLKKAKSLPVEFGFDEYLTWFINSKMFFSQEWVEKNKEYVNEMNQLEKEWNQEFLNAVSMNDFSGVRKGFKRILNMDGENKVALNIAVENKNLQIVKYLVSKKMSVTEEHLSLKTSPEVLDFLTKKVEIKDKKKPKLKM